VKSANQGTRYVSRLSTLFLSTNMVIYVLETVLRREETNWKRVVQPTPARPGTPDYPVVHRTVSGAPGWPTVNRLLLGIDGVVRL
jgi:hypothetical protein